jgi:tripartite-type tricarboxylate transporter receptor subunit TctC
MKHVPRRQFLHLAAGAAALAAISAPAAAQDWPNRPVTMVVPLAAGSAADAAARILAQRLSELLGQQFIIENVIGAGGMIGASHVAKAPPDGYQFVYGTVGTHAHSQTLYKKPLYNAATDFTPVVMISDSPLVLVARQELPVSNLSEFIAYARVNQSKMSYGSAGTGSATHLACALLNEAIGVNVTHVPYRGGNQAMQDLVAGLIDYHCGNLSYALPQIESKTAKAIAIVTRDRSTLLPTGAARS